MDEEFLKRNTDCVYFLASPLTCKKGIECEYRHSEIARLNPRECWYWLSGGCLNPTCAFRHPPLDGYTGEASEPATSSLPANATNVPCYYYFNGYCNKGDRCSFLHSTDSEEPQAKKVPKTTSANSESLHLENKAFPEIDLGSAPLTNGHSKPKQELQFPALKGVPSQSSSPQISVSLDEETIDPIGQQYSLAPEPGFVQSIAYAYESHGSDEQAYEDEIERDERSSPGFDVLVDGEEENLDSEDGHESRRDLIGHYSRYEFENPDEYNPSYPELELRYRYNPQRGDIVFSDSKNFPGQSRPPVMFGSDLTRERRLVKMGPGFVDYRGGPDIRDRLGTQSLIDGRSFHGGLSRKRKASQSQRNLRLGSEVVKKNRALKKKQRNEKRRAKRQRLASQITKQRSTNESEEFSGPKTLAQIRDEKMRAGEERKSDFDGKNSRRKSRDFEGPKPLSEILKDKRKF